MECIIDHGGAGVLDGGDGAATPRIVAADEHFVEIWTPEMALPAVENERVEWLPAGATGPLSLSLSELFRPL